MTTISKRQGVLAVLASAAIAAPASLLAQPVPVPETEDPLTTVYGESVAPTDLSALPEGPEIEGFISARKGDRMKVSTANGEATTVWISETTDIRAKSGFLGINRKALTKASLLNGLPVTVRTVQWDGGLIASRVNLSSNDLETAQMIQTGTAQGFAEQTAATDALRNRVADIDQYNIKGTTNVFFDTGKWNLSGQAQSELCQTASQAEATDNALLLVVGYTDSVGDYDYNQVLSEKRASRVVNYLQQQCGWKPYRMLTPTGMAEADPLADNETEAGKAQNRRVAVNILVSKSVEGL